MRILIVENDRKHRDDACKFFAQHYPDVEIMWAELQVEALSELSPYGEKKAPDGVISDIFFPFGYPPHDTEEPCGVAVMVVCREKDIPCVLNTAGYHHGLRYQWICDLTARLGGPLMVDTGSDYQEEKDSKNWDLAFRRLKAMMEGKKGYRPEAE